MSKAKQKQKIITLKVDDATLKMLSKKTVGCRIEDIKQKAEERGRMLERGRDANRLSIRNTTHLFDLATRSNSSFFCDVVQRNAH